MKYDKTELNIFAQNLYNQKMQEGKHGHYETMFHVIHKCIERVHPAPSQQEERVRELESVLDVVLNQLKKWQANGGVKSGYEFIDVAITVINAALSKEQGK